MCGTSLGLRGNQLFTQLRYPSPWTQQESSLQPVAAPKGDKEAAREGGSTQHTGKIYWLCHSAAEMKRSSTASALHCSKQASPPGDRDTAKHNTPVRSAASVVR